MKLFTESGFLSQYGKETFEQSLDKEIKAILNTATSEEELRLLGSLISNRVGNMVADCIVARKQKANQFQSMTDEQFESYLKTKYGDRWMLVSLTPEEFERCPVPSKEEINKVMEEGRKAREAAQNFSRGFIPSSHRRYR